jgi:histone-lysine N-methyltransferase SETD2
VQDVPADGNCGFWAIAGLVSIVKDNAAVQVRKDLLNELYSNLTYYQQMWPAERIEELTETLSFFESCPERKYWMQMPDMGPLIASTYGVAFFHLSRHQCITYLPHRSAPPTTSIRKEIAMGFVNGNHFVQVQEIL